MLDLAALLFFPAMMAMAASSDLLTMRIPNRLVLAIIVGFGVVALGASFSLEAIAWHLIAGLAVLIGAFAFFCFGWVGGGDAKLASAVAIWLGFGGALPYLVYAALLGGALTLAILALRQMPLPSFMLRVGWIERLHNHRNGVPYGIALAAAGLVMYSDSALFQHFVL